MSETCILGSVVDVSAGQPAPKPNEFGAEGRPFIRAGSLENLLNGGTLADCEKIPQETAIKKRFRLYPRDTIVFAKSGMSATLGRVYRLTEEAHVVSHLAALVPTGRYDPTFLTYWLRKNPPSYLIKDPAYPSIRVGEIESIEVPAVPLEEQHRIAAILDKADGIRCKRNHALAMVHTAVESTFLDLFGDPASNPKGWRTSTIGELGVVQGGLQVSQKRDELTLRKPYLRVANVFRDRLALDDVKEIGLTATEFERVKLQEGDVLIVEGHGNPDEIGRASVWDGSIKECVHQNHLIRFRADASLVLPDYISRMLNSQGGRRQLIAAGRTTSGLNTISTKKVKEVVVRVPPIELQQKFKRLLQMFQAIVIKMEFDKYEADGLFVSLSQRAFRGEV